MSSEWTGHRDGYLRVDILNPAGVKLGELDGVDDINPGQLTHSIHQEIRSRGSLNMAGTRTDWLTVRRASIRWRIVSVARAVSPARGPTIAIRWHSVPRGAIWWPIRAGPAHWTWRG